MVLTIRERFCDVWSRQDEGRGEHGVAANCRVSCRWANDGSNVWQVAHRNTSALYCPCSIPPLPMVIMSMLLNLQLSQATRSTRGGSTHALADWNHCMPTC